MNMCQINKINFKNSVIAVLLGLAVLLFFMILEVQFGYNFLQPRANRGCVTNQEELTVRGSSLEPIITDGDTIQLVYGYYNCNKINKEDIVVYDYSGNDVPIIKIIKAVPGDNWRIQKNDDDTYGIYVNDLKLTNSEGDKYQISNENAGVLKLYTKSYPIIPENTYLILGNQIYGTLDATKFGLIDKSGILGKVL